MLVVISSVCVYPTRSPVRELEVDVTANIQAINVVVLSFSEVEEVTLTVVAYVCVELSELTTTLEFCSHIVARLCLVQIVRGIELLVWITVRVCSCSSVINLLFCELCSKTIVEECLVVQGHVLSTVKICWVCLCNIHGVVSTSCNLKRSNSTALGGDKDCTLCSTTAIENDSRCALHECDVLYLGWENVVCVTRNTINDYECLTLVPQLTVVTCCEGSHIVKAIGVVVLLQKLSHVYLADRHHYITGISLAESHIDGISLCLSSFLCHHAL